MWDFPGPGIRPVSPALASIFLSTVPPQRSRKAYTLIKEWRHLNSALDRLCAGPLYWNLLWGGSGLLKPWHHRVCSWLQITVPGIATLMQGLQPSSWIEVLGIELCFCKSAREAEVSASVPPFGIGNSGLNGQVYNLFPWPLWESDTRVSTKEKKKNIRLYFITENLYFLEINGCFAGDGQTRVFVVVAIIIYFSLIWFSHLW